MINFQYFIYAIRISIFDAEILKKKVLLFVSSYSEIILFKMTRLKFPLYPCRILI